MVFCRGKGKKPEMSSEELRAKIVGVARKHFAKHGYNGVSLKEVAQESEIANSLINYHFKDKDGLFRECIEPFARGRMDAMTRILGEPKSRDDFQVRIQLFVEEMLSAMMADVYGFEILDREMRAENPVVIKLFEDTLLKNFMSVQNFFKQAQDNGLLKPDLDPMILASVLFTSSCESVRKDFLAKRFFNVSFEQPEWRRKYAEQLANLFLNGVAK